MACPAILTGDRFLSRVLAHIDCQAQLLGSLGWQELAQPGSLAATVVAALLTLFIAFFAFRLLFGPSPGGRDLVLAVIKIGIVLTIAFSWPAFRTVIYDLTLLGPADVASRVLSPIEANDGLDFADRLQRADDAMVRLTEVGSGRNVGTFVDQAAPGGTFAGSALADETGFGFARLTWLSSIIGSLALLRIVAGLLLALAPLAAGLLLFEATRGLFSGWLRGLVLALVGSLGVTAVLAAELAVLNPWLEDALRLRGLGYATPAAPIELFALTLAFGIAKLAAVWYLSKVAFTRGWISLPDFPEAAPRDREPTIVPVIEPRPVVAESRAQRISELVENQVHREERTQTRRIGFRSGEADEDRRPPRIGAPPPPPPERLGSSWREPSARRSGPGRLRDLR